MTALFDRGELTSALQVEVSRLVDDLRVRADEVPEVRDLLTGEWEVASGAGRTAFDLETWREGELTQVAVSWVLGCVFVRFCEENDLIPDALLSGDAQRRRWANDAKVQFFRENTAAGERAWLLHVFQEVAAFPGLADVFGSHNPLWRFGPSDDAARVLLEFWQATDPESGELRWDFTESDWDTRFLGDLYQDLSEYAKKQFALLQTPDFVESFILDRTLEPALAEFGLRGHDGTGFRLIDPACGSGHFLLGAFDRLAKRCLDQSPGDGAKAAAARALTMVFGVDLNPFAVSIARFRLLVAALQFANVKRLSDAPNFTVQVATGDSLLWGGAEGRLAGVLEAGEAAAPSTAHLYATEDGDLLRHYLGQQYHAVVANPPYITPKDPAANTLYRQRFPNVCSGKYSLAVPFMARLFDLAIRGVGDRIAGYVGQITANSFMKRQFGKKLIEDYLASEIDLTYVIDTSGAYIPGHGTPTVILVGRNRRPVGETVRAVLGIRGEPSSPDDPARGLVWSSVVQLWDRPGRENDYISTVNAERTTFASHPWSLQGGAAGPLKVVIESGRSLLSGEVSEIGVVAVPGTDDALFLDWAVASRKGLGLAAATVEGEQVRDYQVVSPRPALFPYSDTGEALRVQDLPSADSRYLWRNRQHLGSYRWFGKNKWQRDVPWFHWGFVATEKLKTPLSIAFAAISTHNNFVLDRGGKVFKQSAPVIKLEAEAGVDEHLQLLGLLNSAVACFWMKQVFQGKPSNGVDRGLESEAWTVRSDINGTKLKQFPVADGSVLSWAARLDELAQELSEWLPGSVAESKVPSAELWAESRKCLAEIRGEMVWLQDELDWRCAHLYGVTEDDLSLSPEEVFGLDKGERAFEIALARRMASGDLQSEWFRRHNSTPITELPAHWPDDYRAVVERRLDLIDSNRFVNLLERPEYKRRWNWESWEDQAEAALVEWMATRLEDAGYWPEPSPRSVAQLADVARSDAEFVQVAELYRGTTDLDYVELVGQLMKPEAVPYLAAWRYKEPGMRKRVSWEKTWELQRREDAGEDVGRIPVPPKYTSSDFRSTDIWKARGKLDVPKERFVSYPGCERATDPTPVYGWAGWGHLQQANALVALYRHRYEQEGWSSEQLIPVLAGLGELLPWLRQWHNEFDPNLGQGLGDYFTDYHRTEIQRHHLTPDELAAWRPPTTTRRKRSKTKTS